MNRPANIDAFLARLDKVKETTRGGNRWLACCPAHDDKHPSLTIALAQDTGNILVKCWHGCEVADIVAAVGLELSDLFPENDKQDWNSKAPRRRQRWLPHEAFEALIQDAMVIELAAEEQARGKTLTEKDRQRLAEAVGRFRSAREAIGYA